MRRAPPLFLVLAITAAAFPGASMASPPAPIRAAQSLCAPAMALGANLIANGDAEGQAGATDAATVIAPLCWTASPSFTAIRYGANGFPTPNAIPGGGASFFGGGPSTAESSATQMVDITSLGAAIDGGVRAVLSGYLGGYSDHRDTMVVRAEFLSAADALLGQVAIGPILPAERGDVTGLLPRSASVDVPSQARRVRITMTATRQDGQYDDGYADNLSLVLSAPGATLTPLVFIPGIMGSKLYNARTHVEIWESGVQAKDAASILQLRDIAAADIIPTDILDPYAPLRAWLTGDGGYREYPPDYTETPLARCQRAQSEGRSDITLFVFAYDWRQDNDANTDDLRALIDCVRSLHPNQDIHLLAHSMGGLLARRYLLKYPDHHVAKLLTIGTPWLGAPKTINGLETGDVLDLRAWWAPIVNAIFKSIIAEFPSAAQLLPSRGAYTVGVRPFAEEGWDINANHTPSERYDSYADLVAMLDGRYTHAPGSANQRFHDTQGQDDWRGGGMGVQFYHIVGVQNRERTIGALRAVEKTACTQVLGVPFCRVTYRKFEPDLALGDGTVPLLSAERIGAGQNLNDPAATIWEVDEQGGDGAADHTEMTANPRVHACLLTAFQGQGACALHAVANAAVAPAQARPPALPTTYLDATGVSGVTVADPLGNTTDTSSGTFSALVPDVTFERLGDASYLFMLPTDRTYTVTLHTGADPLLLDLRQGNSSTTIRAVRYLDLALPAHVEAMIRLTPQGIEQLRYDADGDGTFETAVAPTVVTSTDDSEPPIVTASVSGPLSARTLMLSASDSGSGVQGLFYSLDGASYQPYSGPLTIDGLQTPEVSVFADDAVANRSSVLTVAVVQRLHLPIVQH